MAVSIDALSTAKTALLGRNSSSSLSSLVGGRPVSSLKLPSELSPDPFSSPRIILSAEDVNTALGLAISAGNAILGALGALKSSFSIADHSSLVSTSTNLTIDGTRISRINIQSQAQLVIDQIDTLVKATEFKGTRLISSKGGNVTLQTTAYGGSIVITPQPMDSTGLGIVGLDLKTETGVDSAIAVISNAIVNAGNRIGRLKSLQSVLTRSNPISSGLAEILSSGQSSTLPRGSLINLIG